MIKSSLTYRSILALSVVVIFILASCNSKKNIYTGDINAKDALSATPYALFDNLAESYKPWDDFYTPVTLSLESPKKMSISGRATMVYGKEILISLRMLGMEVGVVYIDNDYIYVIDKFHKYYFQEEIKSLLKGIDVSITDVQDLLLGRAIIPGKGVIKPSDVDDFTFLSSDNQWILTPVRQFKGAEWHYLATKTEPPLLDAVSLRLDNGTAVECKYSEPTNTFAGVVNSVCTFSVPYIKREVKVSILWDLGDSQWNTSREAKFSKPSSSYKKLDIESLIKNIDKF